MFVKKLISYLLLPYPDGLMLILGGLVLLWFTKRQRAGKIAVSVGLAVLLLFSCGGIASWYMAPLSRFSPLSSLASVPGARWIVVLGSGYSNEPGVPPTSRLDPQGLQRLVEAIRLYRTNSAAKLLVSGGTFGSSISQAAVMGEAAESLGVPRADIVLEDSSDDTQDEAKLVRNTVGAASFILVTSREHMRRSMALFHKQGLNPIPAPAGFWSGGRSFLPSSSQLSTAAAAEHEYLGMLWSALRGTL